MINAVQSIINALEKEGALDNTLLIASTGLPSRVLYAVKDRPQNFYVMGSLGAAVGIGIGLALNTTKNVIVIAGDGDILLNLGNLALMNHLNLSNLAVMVLDNNSYCTTGNQPTCSGAVDFDSLAQWVHTIKIKNDRPDVGRIGLTPEQITERFYNAINSSV